MSDRARFDGVPRLLTTGEPMDGVVRFGRELAAAVTARTGRAVGLPSLPAGAGITAVGPLHVQVTDRLWGASPQAAADRLEALAAAVPLTVTLHDVPQESDGPERLPRRAAAYRRIARAARGVACSSAHEATLLREVVDVAPAIIPLAVAPAPPAPRPKPDDEAAVIGYFYPGKGHAEVVVAVAELGDAALGVSVLGSASAGHEGELRALADDAEARGVRLTVSGYLDEITLLERARRTAVPVAAHRHVSASGSLNSWIAAGRRPLAPDGAYTREMAALRPGTLTLFPPGGLPAAIARARRAPETTWCGPGATLRPDRDDLAAAYLEWWRTGVAW